MCVKLNDLAGTVCNPNLIAIMGIGNHTVVNAMVNATYPSLLINGVVHDYDSTDRRNKDYAYLCDKMAGG